MSDCKDYELSNTPPCSIERPKHEDAIEMAGKMVGMDLTKPVDVSLMQVRAIRSNPHLDMFSLEEEYKVKRETTLHAWITNEFGEREELTISIELISKRMPKL